MVKRTDGGHLHLCCRMRSLVCEYRNKAKVQKIGVSCVKDALRRSLVIHCDQSDFFLDWIPSHGEEVKHGMIDPSEGSTRNESLP